MKGLELSRGYYEEYGRPMLEGEFAELLPYLAIGCVGAGSDRYGFDDESSRDHDFEPGFCLFLPDESVLDRRSAFLLERAYAKLPKEYGGCTRQKMSPVGGNRNGVMRTAEFYLRAVGSKDGELGVDEWLSLPDYALAEAVNGEVFADPYGEFTRIREKLAAMPEDILRKRLAGNLLLMEQSGQYNFTRCLRHGEPEAAKLACGEFVRAAIKAVFLLNSRYAPYYKWSFRALRQLDGGDAWADALSDILCADIRDPAKAVQTETQIEALCAAMIRELNTRGLCEARGDDLERHAYAVNDSIRDGELRNRNIFAGT